MLTRQRLMRIKTRALRRRVWFKVTSRLERGIIDLTIRCVERVRSLVLAGILSEIIRKIVRTLENGFLEMVNRVGGTIAEKVCGIAERWGNENASTWRHDSGFIRFLGINAVNSRSFGVCEGA
ncbi:hypothetical protein E3J74_08860 [Candidatus Bathyarchaeota archaeon]|nr:MAG: hypothetical protein E3J74_08860 [Candidatus Bathyarchaeota archaeon]